MITEQDLQAAIAECQGARNPNAATCIKLAAFYTIKEHLFPESKIEIPPYSFSDGGYTISYDSGTEFAEKINGRNPDELWSIIDELVTAVQVFNPRLYDSFMDKL